MFFMQFQSLVTSSNPGICGHMSCCVRDECIIDLIESGCSVTAEFLECGNFDLSGQIIFFGVEGCFVYCKM